MIHFGQVLQLSSEPVGRGQAEPTGVAATFNIMEQGGSARDVPEAMVRRLRSTYGDADIDFECDSRVHAPLRSSCPFAAQHHPSTVSANIDASTSSDTKNNKASTSSDANNEASTGHESPILDRHDSASGENSIEQLWAMLKRAEVPASAAVRWEPLREIYLDLMGGGYDEIVRQRGDVKGTPKRLCSQGLVALCEIQWLPGCRQRWSGLFGGPSSGVGLLRLSTACKPPFASRGGGGGLPWTLLPAASLSGSLQHASAFPCLALKFARGRGAPSANFLFAGKKTGQPDDNIFTSALCTALTEKTPLLMKPLLAALRRYSAFPMHLGLSDAAACHLDGTPTAGTPTFPWCLILVPTDEARRAADGASTVGEPGARFIAALPASGLGDGTALYDVFAAASPRACNGPSAATDATDGLLRVGRLVLRSRFVRTSEDDKLVFWHQLKEEDYALRPDWAKAHGEQQRNACGADDFARLIAGGHYVDV